MEARSMVESDQLPRFSFISATTRVSVASSTWEMDMPPVISRTRRSLATRGSVFFSPAICQKAAMRAGSAELKASSHCLKTRRAVVSEGWAGVCRDTAKRERQSRMEMRLSMLLL